MHLIKIIERVLLFTTLITIAITITNIIMIIFDNISIFYIIIFFGTLLSILMFVKIVLLYDVSDNLKEINQRYNENVNDPVEK